MSVSKLNASDTVIHDIFNSGTATSVTAISRVTGLPPYLIKESLKKLPLYQTGLPPKPQLKTKRRWRTQSLPGTSYHADLMDIRRQWKGHPDRYQYLLVIVDVATRYLCAGLCLNKTAAHVGAMAVKTLALFPIEKPDGQITIVTDSGSEFQSEFKAALGDDYNVIESNHTRGAQLAERTIREIRKLHFHFGQQAEVADYVRFLQQALEAYNARRHTAFKNELSPCGAATYLEPHELMALIRNEYQPVREPPSDQPEFKVNDVVRVRRVRKTFEKTNDYTPWSSQTFRVSSHRVLDGVHTYTVVGESHFPGKLYKDVQTAQTMLKVEHQD